jgi:hypothetical protein
MKNIFFLAIILVSQGKVFAQRIVEKALLNDIDDYDESDTAIIKHNFFEIDLYSCNVGMKNIDSCHLYAQQKYNKAGKLIELIKGEDIRQNKIDYWVSYKKINDSLFESIATYPPASSLISDFNIDTVINERRKKVCLYKKDKNDNLVMRSVYKINKDGQISYINRYDMDSNLVEVYYPFGRRKIKKEWTDTIRSEYQKIIDHHIIYEENDYEERTITNNKNNVVEQSYLSTTFDNGFKSIQNSVTIYNERNNPVIIMTFDENNNFISEERYFYKGDIVVRYTKDENLEDTVLNEENIADESGKIVASKSHLNHSKKTSTWKYYYNKEGLDEKHEYYEDNKLVGTKIFKYK